MRKNTLQGISILCISIIVFQFSGCNESNPIQPESGTVIPTVSGNVISFWGEPKSNIRVSTDSTEVFTDASGNFTFTNVSSPYNLYFSDSAMGQYYAMTELSTNNIKFAFTAENYGWFTNTCRLKVNIAPNALGNVNAVKYVFTDGKYLNAYGFPGDNFTDIRINEYSTVTGKLIVLAYREENNKTVAYENFGYKDVTLTTGGQVTVNFDSTELTYNPEESMISGTFINTGSSNLYRVFSFSFGEKHTPNYSIPISFDRAGSTADFSYVVPESLPLFFKPMVYMQTIAPQIESGRYRVAVDPGTTGGVYPMATQPALLAPQEGESVNTNTQFTYIPGPEEGLSIVKIFAGQKQYWIYTGNEMITLEAISNLGFSLIPGESYSWSVSKIGPYPNMNELASEPYNLTQYNSTSERRTFTVAP